MGSIRKFSDIQEQLRHADAMKIAVISAHDAKVLLSLRDAAVSGFIFPLLIGNTKIIAELMQAHELTFPCRVIEAETGEESANIAAELAAEGKVSGLMKGLVSSSVLLKAVLDRRYQLRTEKLISHVTVTEVPAYNRMLIITDAAVNIAPDFDRKRRILENAVNFAQVLGLEKPVVAVLCAVEKEQASMQATIDAGNLRQLYSDGIITNAIISGPLSLDLAVSSEAARIKGVVDEAAGKADILLVPEIETGNVLVKSLSLFAGLAQGGLVLGARVPIVLTSRSDSAESKYNSLLLCALYRRR